MPTEFHNPFPGLRPFRDEEDYLFFGREEQTLELVALLRQHRFLAVVGTSGSGKSSLVRAGLLPALHGGTMAQAGSSWEIVVMKPGGDPVANLATALVEADFYDPDDKESAPRLEATLNRSRQGLVEAVKQSDADPASNVLIVVDQFEELFRFRQRGLSAQEAAGAFVKLLLHASGQSERPVYIAITMRSDYLGDCAQVPGLAEAVNDGEYLIPRLRRQQRRDAIEKPVHVGGAEIAERLVQRLLNDVGDDADQLPVLQHALMRTWDVWENDHTDGEPIDLRHYQDAGAMEQALSLHADSVYDSLPDGAHRSIAEKLFKALTERTSDNREIRRPQKLAALAAIAGTDPDKATTVIDAYRKPGITFLMPTSEVDLTPETVVDISHESLMRVWSRLRNWVNDESQSARIYHRLFETSQLWQQKKAGLYHDPDLGIAHAWRDANQPTAAWADLYGGGFDTAITFLETSQQSADKEAREKEETRQRELAQAKALAESQAHTAALLKRFAATVAVALVAAIALSIFAFKQSNIAEQRAAEADAAALEAEAAKESAYLAQGKTSLVLAGNSTFLDGHFQARLLAGRAIGFENFGAESQPESFAEEFPRLIPPDHPDWPRANRLAGSSVGSLPAWVHPNFRQHPAAISTLAIHPDGKVAATGGEDTHDLYIWDLETNRLLHKLTGHTQDVEALAFSNDGSILASAGDQGDNAVIFWNTSDYSEIDRVVAASGDLDASGIHAMDFRFDDRFLTAGDETGTLFVIDVAEMEVRQQQAGIPSRIFDLSYSPNGKTIAVCGQDGALYLLDSDALTLRHQIPIETVGNRNLIASLAFAPDDKWMVATARFNTPEIWDLTADPPQRMGFLLRDVAEQDPDFHLRCDTIAISDDGQRIAVSWNEENWGADAKLPARPTVSVFDSSDPANPVLLHNHWGHPNFIRCLEFVPGSHHYAAADDTGLITHRDADCPPAQLDPLPGHPDDPCAMAISPDGRWFLTADRLANTFLWDAAKGTIVTALTSTDDQVSAAVFAPDSKSVYTAHYLARTIRVWDVPSGALKQSLSTDFILDDLAISPDGRSLIACGDTNSLAEFSVSPDATLAARPEAEVGHWCSQVAFLPDGRLVASGAGNLSFLHRQPDGSWHRSASVANIHESYTSSVAVHPDGTRIAVSSRHDAGTVTFWDVGADNSLTQVRNLVLRGLSTSVSHLAYSPGGDLIAACTGDNTTLWNAATGDPVTNIPGTASPRYATFTPGGRYLLAFHEGGSLALWDRGGAATLAEWTGLTGRPDGLAADEPAAVGPSGLAYLDGFKKLAVCGGFTDQPGAIRIWDFEASAFTRSLELPELSQPSRPNQIAIAPDGHTAVVSFSGGEIGTDGGVFLYDLSAPEGTPPATLYTGSGASSLAIHPDGGTLVVAHSDKKVRVFALPDSLENVSPDNGKIIEAAGHLGAYRGLSFSPDGTKLVIGNGFNVLVLPFDPDSRQFGAPTSLQQDWAFGTGFSHDGSFIASVSPASTELRLWDTRSLTPLGDPLPLPFNPIHLRCSPTANLIAIGGRNGSVAVVDASNPDKPLLVADFSFDDGSGWFFTRKMVFGSDNRSITLSQENGNITTFRIDLDPEAKDLTRYLDTFTFNDGGNVVWRPTPADSLNSLASTFPPRRAASPYLAFIEPDASPPSPARALLDHYVETNNPAAAESALLAFPDDHPPTDADWESIGRLLSGQFDASASGQKSRLSYQTLTRIANRVGEHTTLPPKFHLAILLNESRFDDAQNLLIDSLPDMTTDARQRLLDRFFDAVNSLADPSDTAPPTLSKSEPPLPDLPVHVALASTLRHIATETLDRSRTNSSLSLIDWQQHPSRFVDYLIEHCLASHPPLVPKGSTWHYFDQNRPAPNGWNQPDFDDSSWPSGPADIGFGSGDEDLAVLKTTIPKQPLRITYYFRHTFEIDQLPQAETLTLFLQRDDSAVIYVNGTELFRNNLPGGPIDDTTRAFHAVPTAEEFNFLPFNIPTSNFVPGTNTLAVEIHQSGPRSSDIHFDLAITTAPLLPQDAIEKARTFLGSLAAAGTGEPWLPIATTALGAYDPAEDFVATVARSRIESVLLLREAELASLKTIAGKLRGSPRPADWKPYRDILRRRAEIFTLLGDDEAAELLLAEIATAPPRPQNLPETQLDLTKIYNSSLFEGSAWVPTEAFENTDLGNVTATLEPHHGIAFDARGIIQLNSGVYGIDTETGGMLNGKSLATFCDREFPTRVDGITVGRTAKAIHVLGATLHNRAETATEVARIALNYADGSSHTVPLIQGKNITGLWANQSAEDPSIIAWTGTTQADNRTVTLHLSHITCPNPHPEKLITSFDFISAEGPAAPFLVAATIEP